MDPYEPYRPQRDGGKNDSCPPATTGVTPTECLLPTKMFAADSPGDSKTGKVFSDAWSVASTRTNASNTSQPRGRIHRGRLRGMKLHWSIPSGIVGLFLLGLLGSLLHHWFYLKLDGEDAEDQFTVTWFGTALAFLTKAALVGSITLAYRQRVWYTLRAKDITLKGIDNLFSLTDNPTRFYSKDVLVRAKVAMVMALVTWIMPLAAVISPGALTTRLAYMVSEVNCTIPTLNTSAQNDAIPERPKYGIGGYELVYFNRSEGPDRLLYLDGIGFQMTRTGKLVDCLGTARPISSPCKGYNCTWNVIFDAPWYECREKSVDEARKALDTMDWIDISNKHWAPQGPITLFVVSDGDEYAAIQPPYRNDSGNMQGYFTDEPTLRVGYVVDTNIPVVEGSADSNNGTWKTVFEPHWLSCDLFKASWNVTFNFTSEIQSTIVKTSDKRRVFEPPKMGPGHPDYRENALYNGFGRLIRNRLRNGLGFKNGSSDTTRYSDYHPLINSTTRLAVANPKGEIEKLVVDTVLTFLSTPFLEIGLNTTVECKKWRFENRFYYNRKSLWIGYAISIIVALVSVFIGMHSIYRNGIASDTLFSRVLVTTRNPTLDKLVENHEGVCLGGDPFPEELEKTRLRFGILDRGDGTTHTAFGTADETEVMIGGEGFRGLESPRMVREDYGRIGQGI